MAALKPLSNNATFLVDNSDVYWFSFSICFEIFVALCIPSDFLRKLDFFIVLCYPTLGIKLAVDVAFLWHFSTSMGKGAAAKVGIEVQVLHSDSTYT